MAQHDYVIDNQASAAARADLNSLFQAIVSQNSGTTAPTTTYANMIWYETDTDTLWKRNEANSAWISLGTLDETNSKFEPNQTFATQAQAEAGTNNTRAMTALRTAQAIAALAGSVDYQVFTASGTWTKPSGISADAVVYFEVIGGGGSGSAYNRGSGSSRNVTGGAGGGCLIGDVLASSLGATVAVTVGSGGAAVTATGNSGATNGNAGGASSFGSYTVPASNGGSAAATAADAYHGFDGFVGGDSSVSPSQYINANSVHGGGAGACAGSGNSAGTSVFSGSGGASSNVSSGNGTATSGTAPGGGGGAAYSNSSSSSGVQTSGAGARGEVRVWVIG